MEDKFKDKYRVKPARLMGWDYGSHGLYYITICTKGRVHYFGEIISSSNTASGSETQSVASPETMSPETQNVAFLQKSEIGEVAYNNWMDIPNHFSFIELDEFTIMPNHLHAILFINKPNKTDWQLNKFGSQSQNLASVIRGFKASVKTYATNNNIEFVWQSRFHDRVIRTQQEYLNIRDYIFNNPEQWLLNGEREGDLFPP